MADAASAAGRLTMVEVPGFLERQRAAIARGEREIDLAAFDPIDSSAIAALVALARESAGSPPRFLNPSPNLRKLAALYGVETLLFPVSS